MRLPSAPPPSPGRRGHHDPRRAARATSVTTKAFTLLLSLALLGACEPSDSARAPHVWSLIEIDEAFRANQPVLAGDTFRNGLPAATFLEANADGTTRPRVLPAFAEASAAAYVVGEMWTNYKEVWLQPWYSLVTAWDSKAPSANRLKDKDGKPAPAIYDVDVDSTFYSPFWRVLWVVVPPDTQVDTYTTSRQLLNAGLPIYEGPPWIYSMRPEGMTLGETKPTHPLLGSEVGTMAMGPQAWIEGTQKPSLNLGGNNFTYTATDVVNEVALFWFVRRGAAPETGSEWPAVVGTGPLGTRNPAEVVGNKPRFGGLCRLHLAAVPPTAAPFDPAVSTQAAEALTKANLDPATYRGRVALNATKIAMTDTACFDDPMFPQSCIWLDSQAAVENRVGVANIMPTEVLMTCPFVSYAGKAVK